MINWRAFFWLLGACVVVSLLVVPFTFALAPSPRAAPPLGAIVLGAAVPALIQFSVALLIGLLLAPRVGLGAPVIEGRKPPRYLASVVALSVGLGLLGGVLVVLLSLPFWSVSLVLLKAEMSVATWKALLAPFDGAIAEEVLFRLFLMTLFVWISTKFKKKADGSPTTVGVWISIVLSAILFGLGHIGITAALTAITLTVILRAVILNGVVAIIYGWLYWKKGLESAMIAHFSTDIVLHVVVPHAIGFVFFL
jgi:membrane protease YdiL (CAAX protease family)